ncbi:axin interactor, dorsalization-associated protein-like [Dysidea avara]|uniref:axin interactor, dorsalization-associated protein-like n=1 Tax=Dysidea avara TaxID=196820 RepID=UPI0033275B49
MAIGGGEVGKLVTVWLTNLSQAADHESWGQPVEASDLYKKLSKAIRTAVSDNIPISEANKRQLAKLSATLDHRAKLAADPTNELDNTDLKDIKSFLEALQAGKEAVCQFSSPVKIPLKNDEVVIDDEDDDEDQAIPHTTQGTLLPQPSYESGRTYLIIHVHKIGIKDPHNYIEPFLRISVKDTTAYDCEPIQQTPVSRSREITYFVFDVDVHIQTPVEDLPVGGAIFFELKHYKPKKKLRVSTRCFSFMELDEIKDGPACLEIYKKPTDFKKKKLLLLSVKPLYLHLTLSLNKLPVTR